MSQEIENILNGSTNDPDGAILTGVTITVDDGRYLVEVEGARVGTTGQYFDQPHEWEQALHELMEHRREEAQ